MPAAHATPDVRSDWFGSSLLPLVTCSPLAYDSTARVIGPDGGTITAGPHTLTIPGGALTVPTLITAVVNPTPVNAIQFSPPGLTFQRPAQLVMSYANCELPGLLVPRRVVYTTDNFQILEIIPSLDDLLDRTVTGQISHFSQYAIAW